MGRTILIECPGVLDEDIAMTGLSNGVMLDIKNSDEITGLPPPKAWTCDAIDSAPSGSASTAGMLEAGSKVFPCGGQGFTCWDVMQRAVWPAIGHSG